MSVLRTTVVFSCCSILLAGVIRPASGQNGREPPPLTVETVTQWMSDLSNWGRWGPDDELGTLNLVTPEKRRAAFDLVQVGENVSLSRDVETERSSDNGSPLEHQVRKFDSYQGEMGAAGDTYSIWYHGYAHSHIDALSHLFFRGEMYNGYSSESIEETGATRLGVQTMRAGITTRAILIDVPRLFDVPYLSPGTAILAEDLDAWERRTGVRVESGDAVLIRTGRWARRAELGPWGTEEFAGLHASAVAWLKERDVSVMGGDAASDVMPSGIEGFTLPVHQLAIVALGMPLLDNLDLEAVAQAAARHNRYEFLLMVLPIRFRGGIGSPVNAVAVF